MSETSRPPGERTWYRLRAVVSVCRKSDLYVISGSGEAYDWLVEEFGRSGFYWPFDEAGIDIPDEPGFYLVEASVWEDGGCDTPSGPAEYWAKSVDASVRSATDEERLGRFTDPISPICPDCGHVNPGNECSSCEEEAAYWQALLDKEESAEHAACAHEDREVRREWAEEAVVPSD